MSGALSCQVDESLQDEEVFLADYQQFLWFLQPFEAAGVLMALCWNDQEDMIADHDQPVHEPQDEAVIKDACAEYWNNNNSYGEEVATVPNDVSLMSRPPIVPVSFGRAPSSSYYDDTAVVPDEDSELHPMYHENYYMYGGEDISSSGMYTDWQKPENGLVHQGNVDFVKGMDDHRTNQDTYDYRRLHSHESGYSTEED